MSDGRPIFLPPTVRLPAIKKIPSSPVKILTEAVAYLSEIYNPEIQGLHYISRTQCSLASGSPVAAAPRRKSNASIAQPANLELDSLRADSFEKAYAVQWLTVLVSQTDHLLDEANWESVVQHAAHLLAICAGAAAAGTRSRVFAFTPRHHNRDQATVPIRVQITDLPLDNQDYSSVGAQTWGGACLLADMIVNSPHDFGLQLSSKIRTPLRILELGAGTGLVGLAVAKLLASSKTPSELVLTDFHPSVLDNLRQNVASNAPSSQSPVSMSVHSLDWSEFPSSRSHDPPFDRVFDTLYGADIIYELEHAQWIKSCVELLLRKPTSSDEAAEQPCFHLVIPLRSTHAAESHTVEEVFPFAPSVRPALESPGPEAPVPRTLAIVAKEAIVCGDIWSDGSREVEYVHYTIAWV